MSWLSGWNYRKPITLSRVSGAVTNYQMKLLIGESSETTGEDVDCNGQCLSTFNDVRFTTANGNTLLDYWIESITNTYDSYTKLMLCFDGVDGAKTFKDETGKVVTGLADAQIDTSQSKFGGSSLFLDGTGDYLTLADSDDWYFGTGDFTIDFWVRFNSLPANAQQHHFFGQYINGTNNFYLGLYNSAGIYYYNFSNNGSTVAWLSSGITSTNTWYHIAVVRRSGTTTIYTQGSSVGNSSAYTQSNLATTMKIGAATAAVGFLINGWMDEFRISKGIARWETDFNPPVREHGRLLATMWIEFNSIGTSATTFYMYYGKASASAYSNGGDTFLFFDHFDGSSIDEDKWVINYGTPTVNNSLVTFAGTQYERITTETTFGTNYAFRSLVGMDGSAYGGINFNEHNALANYLTGTAKFTFRTYREDWGVNTATDISNRISGAYILEIRRNASTSVIAVQNDTVVATHTTNFSTTDGGGRIGLGDTTGTFTADWALVRQYLSTEPAWGSWGTAEEVELFPEFTLIGLYNVLTGTSGNFTSIWADSNTNINSGKIYIGTKGSGGSLSIINMSDKTLYDYYLIDKPGRCNEVLDSENIDDINVVI